MYEEDRLTALTMYERMFDETADEQALLELLVSPTRQAVVLARSYDAKQRKLQIESRSKDGNYMPDPDDVPSFIFVINKTAQQAAEIAPMLPEADENQFSIFDEVEKAPIEESEAAEEVSLEEAPAEESEEPSEEESNVEETANAVDAFLADFSVENGELVSTKAESIDEKTEEAPVEEQPEEAEPAAEEAAIEELEEAPLRYRTKTNVFLLIFYIFLALPATVFVTVLLLAPASLFLAIAATLGSVGAAVLGTCLGSFAVIADTMVVLGAGLVLCALALLFLWIFIWFIGAVIIGFIRAICRLGRKVCCKEVAVQ